MRQGLLAFSLFCNLLFALAGAALAWHYRERLVQAFLDWRGKAPVVFFGDSITRQGDWCVLLGRYDIKNSGIPGLGVFHLKDYIREAVLDYHPGLCLVMAGINDLTLMQRTAGQAADDYEALLKTLKTHGVKTIVQLTLYEQQDPVSKARVDSLNERIAAYCEATSIPFVNPNAWLSDSQGLKKKYARDKTHLNEEGYRVWAREIRPLLEAEGF